VDLIVGSFHASDLTIDEVGGALQGANAPQGFGLISFGTDVAVERLEVKNAQTTGVFVEGGTAAMRDLSVSGSREGNGLGARDVEGELSLSRAVFDDNAKAGIELEGATVASLVQISSSRSASGAVFGDGARVLVTDLGIFDTRSLGICVRDQSHVTIGGLEIQRVRADESMTCTITTPPPGTAIVMNGQPTLLLSRFRLADNRTGILINRDATTSIRDGEIRGSFVGAQLDPEVEPAVIMVRVSFQDNASNVEVY
jgi:hypothetical protein